LLLFLSLSQGVLTNQNPIQPDSVYLNNTTKTLVKQNIIGVENNLREVAKSLAVVLREKKVLKMLKKELGKKFDGEPEVLYKHIYNKTLLDNATLENELFSKSNKNIDIKNIITELDEVMNLNIFMPNYDKWDGDKVPLVTYYPYSKNESDIKEVQAFDSDGNEVMISKENAVNYNYIVLGANERTDRNGNYKYQKYQKSLPPSDDEGGGGGAGGGGSVPGDYYKVILHQWQINYDWDPGWLLGSMELYIKLKIKDTITGQILTHSDFWMIDDSYGVWDPKIYDITLYTRFNNSDFSVYFEIWEDDGWFSFDDDSIANGIWESVNKWNGTYWEYVGYNMSDIGWNLWNLRLTETYIVETPSSSTPNTDYVWLDFIKNTY